MKKVAVVQKSPVVLNRDATIALAVELLDQAASQGAEMIVFTEAFIPGYPAWIWRLRPGSDWGTNEALHKRLLENAVDLESDQLDPLYQAARKHHVTVVCGMHERDHRSSRATLYNTVVVIGPDGSLMNRHRKLMPTNPERMVWGAGDASGLRVINTPVGRIGTLICWENYMPLSRYALYAQGIDIYIAPTYDSGDDWLSSMRHIAREAGCWVINSGNLLHATDMPDDLDDGTTLYPDADEWVNSGDSAIIAPGGELVAGPLRNEEGILYAEIDTERAAMARRTLDIVGHYSRPDIFTLQVDTNAYAPISFTEPEHPETSAEAPQ
ncbi:carbon-nitrogen hydrolase family protein [Candidatus Thiodiazotropha sp. CDECU1]|uniref:carbon-nitrogen hydrolase family protein n=1 Tax=Candidatus Thiodiazotropha sp. CDECU1 TaxID=3065865 RepID=UPI00292E51BF|nr:carbon-nitrogen hydrolase family protein [Candidatus Thiodiazotropha sp. CDECU1]